MKHIVYCADGTWNGPGELPAPATADTAGDIDAAASSSGEGAVRATNVWKAYANLAGEVTPETEGMPREQEKVLRSAAGEVLQVAKYMHGVGDSGNLVIKALGGILGAGVIARIVRGYTFISRNYQAGDAIHIVGFSRGAYTARALAGMICAAGLLDTRRYDPADKQQAYLRGYAAWLRAQTIVVGQGGTLATRVTGWLRGAARWIAARVTPSGDYLAGVPVQTVAVWDTVGSMGLPLYIQGQRRDAFSFVDTKLNPLVQRGFHAMALDERRRDFPVTRWVARKGVEELWFVGSHSDVGGGYPAGEAGLSDLALDWLGGCLGGQGLSFKDPLEIQPVLTGFARAMHTPWDSPPFNIGEQPRAPTAGDAFHPSVLQRWQALAGYQAEWPVGSVVALYASSDPNHPDA
jgi:hypothetical protein